ncbi:MAG: hypothetical protein KAH99_01180 [Verrucomicrobia bacterium]|nr:hypothetical protein [Verrucomicrobiota bacterium]
MHHGYDDRQTDPDETGIATIPVDGASSFVAHAEPNDKNEAGSIVYIQTAKQMREGLPNIGKINEAMTKLLDQLNATPHCLQ